MRFALAVLLLTIASSLFSWVFGFGGSAIIMFLLPTFAPTTSAYLAGVLLIDIASTVLSCWLAVFSVTKMGQLKSIDYPKRLAGAVTLVFVAVDFLFILPVVIAGGKPSTFTLASVGLSLVVTYFTLRFFLVRLKSQG
ncbi:MAG: hypothetical protein Q7S50_03330 [bacterium]|nr:hypothetical protein [bacterium]